MIKLDFGELCFSVPGQTGGFHQSANGGRRRIANERTRGRRRCVPSRIASLSSHDPPQGISATHFTDRTSRTCIRYVSVQLVQTYIYRGETRDGRESKGHNWRRKASCPIFFENVNERTDCSYIRSVTGAGVVLARAAQLAATLLSSRLSLSLSLFLFLSSRRTMEELLPPSPREIAAVCSFPSRETPRKLLNERSGAR